MSTSSGVPPTCTTQPSVSACACAGSSSGQGAPTSASRCQSPAAARISPVSASRSSGRPGRGSGRSAATSAPGTGKPSLSSGTAPSGASTAPSQRRIRAIATVSAGGRRPPGRAEQVRHVDEVGEHLAVVGRRALVVAAVGQHLHGQLAVSSRSARRSSGSSPRKTPRPISAFRSLIRWLPPTSDSRCRRRNPACAASSRAELGVEVGPGDQVAVQAAPGPGAQRRGVRQPRVAAAEGAGRLPRPPQPGEHLPCGRAVRLGGQAPGPVPVVQVKAPQLRRVGLLPVAERSCGHAEQPDLARPQLGQARPVPGTVTDSAVASSGRNRRASRPRTLGRRRPSVGRADRMRAGGPLVTSSRPVAGHR